MPLNFFTVKELNDSLILNVCKSMSWVTDNNKSDPNAGCFAAGERTFACFQNASRGDSGTEDRGQPHGLKVVRPAFPIVCEHRLLITQQSVFNPEFFRIFT